MTEFYRLFSQSQLPSSSDAEMARINHEHWRDALNSAEPSITSKGLEILESAEGPALLDAIFGNSPFLSQCLLKFPAFSCLLLTEGPESALATIKQDLSTLDEQCPELTEVSVALRVAKRKIALTTALADITRHWPLMTITETLSDFAGQALDMVCRPLLRQADRSGKIKLPNENDPLTGSGLVILGMGKLGARELNYSSDIDIIVLYDDEIIQTDRPEDLQQTFVRLTRNMVKAMDDRTVDGYVFRTDLRLRPDPGSTPLALSIMGAELYYESIGQNWERAAMIKARPVAGDIEAGEGFLERLRPFIWRKNLDFASIQDIHSIKRQINAHRGGSQIAVNGHNVKLGRGGIREVEFYAQTQQLIWGGRDPSLREIRTRDALTALAKCGRITQETADQLTQSYDFLRCVEHRIQMTDDNQTHSIPENDQDIRRLALFLGYDDAESFEKDLLFHLSRVEGHYVELFEEAPTLSGTGLVEGNLVFTGGEPDPDTLKTLEKMGFKNALAVDTTIRGWHHGRYRSTRSTRTRQMLTELMPVLLGSLAKMADPDAAFNKFDEFLANLPSGVQLFSMFTSNPQLLGLLAELMGGAPKLASHLSRHSALLESVLTSDFFAAPPGPETLKQELQQAFNQSRDFQDDLEIVRRWANDRKFQVGVQSLRSLIDAENAGVAYSNIADIALGGLKPRIEDEFAKTHGKLPESEMAIIAMGKLGGREMTPSSDLDLIYVYDAADGEAQSDGRRPLTASQYFARLSQRLINGITAPMGDGMLYEVDMRLRPSGNSGPIATSMSSFIQYQAESAWTWEHMALTRSRVIAGPVTLKEKIERVVEHVLTRERDAEKLVVAVADMRTRMEKEHGTKFIWEVKHRRGGLIDIEFITQFLQLKHAAKHPDILSQNTSDALRRITEKGLIEATTGASLLSALKLWQTIQGLLRLTIEGYFNKGREEEISPALQEILARATGTKDFDNLLKHMDETAQRAHGHFVELIERPAESLRNKFNKEEIL